MHAFHAKRYERETESVFTLSNLVYCLALSAFPVSLMRFSIKKRVCSLSRPGLPRARYRTRPLASIRKLVGIISTFHALKTLLETSSSTGSLKFVRFAKCFTLFSCSPTFKCKDFKWLPGQVLFKLCQFGHFLYTWQAPARPEIHQHNLATVVGQ